MLISEITFNRYYNFMRLPIPPPQLQTHSRVVRCLELGKHLHCVGRSVFFESLAIEAPARVYVSTLSTGRLVIMHIPTTSRHYCVRIFM